MSDWSSADVIQRALESETHGYAAELLRGLLDSTEEGIWGINEEGRCVFANPACVRALGYASVDDVLGRDMHALTHHTRPDGSPYPVEECGIHRAYHSGKSAVIEDEFLFRADGTRVPVRYRASPIILQGKVAGAVVVFSDDTVRRQRLAEAERQADFEQQLLGIVGHDLKNPVAAIRLAAAALLRRDTLDERARATAARILSSVERASRLISELLDFTQVRLGAGIPIHRSRTDLCALVADVVDEVRVAHVERTIEVAIADSCDVLYVDIDGDRIAQVVVNLVTNAIAYSPPQSSVTVRVGRAADAITIAVHNVGAPIPPELIPQIFQPMRRGTSAAPSGPRSVGLGLFIVDHILRAHGATVAVDSGADRGTTFTVTLPCR